MAPRILAIFFLLVAWSGAALAQSGTWIQVEARPTLGQAEDRARAYSGRFQDVSGFALGTGWYAIALGPYAEADARGRYRTLRARGAIPTDSFLSDGSNYGRRFWPSGPDADADIAAPEGRVVIESAILPEPPAATPDDDTGDTVQEDTAEAPTETGPETVPEIVAPPAPPRETLAEARRSEARLTGEERRALQIALRWEGFYDAAIDGAFGRGTRDAMADYQRAKGHEPTGVLTTAQRAEVLAAYNNAFAGLDLDMVVDEKAGIELRMPTALLKFSEYSPPFARYESADGRGVRVLLISQRGNRETLHGLYDIMQTLEIVPVDGERSKQRDSFVLTGQNATVHSYSWARLEDGMIKGFSLIYPPNEAKVMERVAQIMRDSFASTGPKALEIEGGAGAVAPEVDLVSGLEVRRPTVSRSGFYVDGSGTVLTVAEAVRQCGRITIDEAWEAEVDRLDEASGLAVLKPRQSLAPLAHAIFRQRQPQMSAEVAVSGFSFEGALGAPTLTYGTLSDLRGLQGNEEVQRLSVAARSGDAGGPVFDESGAVMGVLLSRGQDGRQLPDDVHFAVKPSAVEQILTQSGVQVARDEVNGVMAPEDLALLASDMTVLVSCWN